MNKLLLSANNMIVGGSVDAPLEWRVTLIKIKFLPNTF